MSYKENKDFRKGLNAVLDDAALMSMLEGEPRSKQMLEIMEIAKKADVPMIFMTTVNNLLAALWQVDPKKTSVEKIQALLELMHICLPDVRKGVMEYNYKSKDGLIKETIAFANGFSEMQGMIGGKLKDDDDEIESVTDEIKELKDKVEGDKSAK